MERPKPFQTPLWEHLDEIRAMRRRKRTWREIAQWLSTEHNISVRHNTVLAFFKRVSRRKQPPLGYPEDRNQTRPHGDHIRSPKLEARSEGRRIDDLIESADEPRGPLFKIRKPQRHDTDNQEK